MSAEQEYLQANDVDDKGEWYYKDTRDAEDVANEIADIRERLELIRSIINAGGSKAEIYEALRQTDLACMEYQQNCMYYDAS